MTNHYWHAVLEQWTRPVMQFPWDNHNSCGDTYTTGMSVGCNYSEVITTTEVLKLGSSCASVLCVLRVRLKSFDASGRKILRMHLTLRFQSVKCSTKEFQVRFRGLCEAAQKFTKTSKCFQEMSPEMRAAPLEAKGAAVPSHRCFVMAAVLSKEKCTLTVKTIFVHSRRMSTHLLRSLHTALARLSILSVPPSHAEAVGTSC
ncbi:hypothetical protein CEXT_216071 [Caerostris extrusa]|uniref:Uncharacterized protein n=1 Tax=Caerostris extrusa TaxID=172846 RepID=A0AAV4SRI1_CAEEX|nr:hypothetical protein CEXT_216071 [Caerostris extrusa]